MKQLLLYIIFFTTPLLSVASEEYRIFINLVDYISNDYPNAIQEGEVINDFEYTEMLEFSDKVNQLFIDFDLNNDLDVTDIKVDVSDLAILIGNKANPEEIKEICSRVKEVFLAKGLIKVAPDKWPDIINGKELYAINCTSCHGDLGIGNGPKSEGLDPAPANFVDADHLNPFHIFNTTTLGIEGTSMLPLPHLTDKEKWDIAFYVQTFNVHDANAIDKSNFPIAASKVSLEEIATITNDDLVSITGSPDNMKAIRFHTLEHQHQDAVLLTTLKLKEARTLYYEGKTKEADAKALDAYFNGFEPIERSIGATNPTLVLDVENAMIQFRAALADDPKGIVVDKHYNEILGYLGEINEQESEDSERGFWFTFIAAFSILIREGLEALFIIIAILAALRAFESKQAVRNVHIGWISAVLLGIVGYIFVGNILAVSAASREIMEGLGALFAVVILLMVGFWLHDKSNASRWAQYVKEKISKHIGDNNFKAIGVLAFVVVFREAFESVIFLSSLTAGGSPGSGMAVFLASIAALVAVVAIALALLQFSKRLPIHKVFKISAITMLILALILAGKGIKELQEAGWASINLMPFDMHIDLLGIYPTLETIGAQIVTIVIAIVLYFVNTSRLKAA